MHLKFRSTSRHVPPSSPKLTVPWFAQNHHRGMLHERQNRVGKFLRAGCFVRRDWHFAQKNFDLGQHRLRNWFPCHGKMRLHAAGGNVPTLFTSGRSRKIVRCSRISLLGLRLPDSCLPFMSTMHKSSGFIAPLEIRVGVQQHLVLTQPIGNVSRRCQRQSLCCKIRRPISQISRLICCIVIFLHKSTGFVVARIYLRVADCCNQSE